jgi:hypothetical protein
MKTPAKIVVLPEIPIEHFPDASLELYTYTCLIGGWWRHTKN